MAKDAWYFLLPLLCLAGLLVVLGWFLLALIPFTLAVFVVFFFRDPDRKIPTEADAVVSPADGKVIKVESVPGGTLVSIFLSIFNVHVNRSPVAGKVNRVEYRPGKFHLAFDERASIENEQLVFSVGENPSITFSLIAGLVARRIIPWKKVGDTVSKGDRIALIRFGSRVDIVLPREAQVSVKRGDRVKGGSTILGRMGAAS
jgi:phosphatidylserine decarboxylase